MGPEMTCIAIALTTARDLKGSGCQRFSPLAQLLALGVSSAGLCRRRAGRHATRRNSGAGDVSDPKGLYARARSGELKGLTGVDAPYEPPESPDLVLDTANADIDELAAKVISLLDEVSPRQPR